MNDKEVQVVRQTDPVAVPAKDQLAKQDNADTFRTFEQGPDEVGDEAEVIK